MKNEMKFLLFSDVPKKRKGKTMGEVEMSREGAIKYGPVSIMALPGQPFELTEYLESRESWEFEPRPDLEKLVAEENPEGIKSFEVGLGGKEKLWRYMKETAIKMSRKGKEIDLELLTPYEALALVSETIKSRIKYDDLVATDEEGKINLREIKNTLRPELLDLYTENPSKFKKETANLKRWIDFQTADRIMDLGYGVCRHVSSVAEVMYELLKERQRGVLLNGTYLLYHGQNVRSQVQKGVVDRHAYNILVVTAPNGQVDLSIVDLTWTLVDQEMDFTWKRISQACSFLSEYGVFLGVDGVEEVVENLAHEASFRLAKFMNRKNWEDFLEDYVSLVDQGVVGKMGGTLDHMVDLLKVFKYSRADVLAKILKTPSYGTEFNGFLQIRSGRVAEINSQLRQIDFAKDRSAGIAVIYNVLGGTIANYILMKWAMKWADGWTELSEDDKQYIEFACHYIRACIDLKRPPRSESQLKTLELIFATFHSHGWDEELQDFEAEYRKLLRG